MRMKVEKKLLQKLPCFIISWHTVLGQAQEFEPSLPNYKYNNVSRGIVIKFKKCFKFSLVTEKNKVFCLGKYHSGQVYCFIYLF